MKFVGIFHTDNYTKGRTDQMGISYKDEGTVTTALKRAYFSGVKEDSFMGPIAINTKDSQSPDWEDYFIVTVERLENIPENSSTAIEDYFNSEIEKKRNEGVKKPLVTGRKFR